MNTMFKPDLAKVQKQGFRDVWDYEDTTPACAGAYREEWLARGAPWNDSSTPHDGLTTEERLGHVPPGFK